MRKGRAPRRLWSLWRWRLGLGDAAGGRSLESGRPKLPLPEETPNAHAAINRPGPGPRTQPATTERRRGARPMTAPNEEDGTQQPIRRTHSNHPLSPRDGRCVTRKIYERRFAAILIARAELGRRTMANRRGERRDGEAAGRACAMRRGKPTPPERPDAGCGWRGAPEGTSDANGANDSRRYRGRHRSTAAAAQADTGWFGRVGHGRPDRAGDVGVEQAFYHGSRGRRGRRTTVL